MLEWIVVVGIDYEDITSSPPPSLECDKAMPLGFVEEVYKVFRLPLVDDNAVLFTLPSGGACSGYE